jgi:hypothetical protein
MKNIELDLPTSLWKEILTNLHATSVELKKISSHAKVPVDMISMANKSLEEYPGLIGFINNLSHYSTEHEKIIKYGNG